MGWVVEGALQVADLEVLSLKIRAYKIFKNAVIWSKSQY